MDTPDDGDLFNKIKKDQVAYDNAVEAASAVGLLSAQSDLSQRLQHPVFGRPSKDLATLRRALLAIAARLSDNES
jgi:hypothetical protein